MCFYCEANKKIGIFLKRDDISHPQLKEFKLNLYVQLLEIEIIDKAIVAFLTSNYKVFDPVVGDCKCQARVSMLVDIVLEHNLIKETLKLTENDLILLKNNIDFFVSLIEKNKVKELEKLVEKLKNTTMYHFFENNNLNYYLKHNILILSLLFFVGYNFENDKKLLIKDLSKSKFTRLLQLAKKMLSIISIEYEQKLSKQYGDDDLQKILNYTETKGFCSMTAFYPSFIPIWNKIKNKKQLVLKKTIFFCGCGGVRDIKSELFRFNNKEQFERIVQDDVQEIAFVIEGYFFNKSLSYLKSILQVPFEVTRAMFQYFKLCTCSKPLNIPVIENLDEAILANFAQHAQFTNDAEIPWGQSGLEDSNLKKEYDRLRTLSGYGIDDMSKFCITHIYASTVGQELEDQRQLLIKLGKK